MLSFDVLQSNWRKKKNEGNCGEERAHPLCLQNNLQMIPICRFQVPKQIMIINKAWCNANTEKRMQVSASYLGHVCICGMNVL